MKFSEFVVTVLPEDPRLDKLIPLHVKDLSRSAARRLIEGGAVYLNKKRCQMNGKLLRVGDKVRVMLAAEKEREEFQFTAERILFEDNDLIVVDKPPGLPTHETIDTSRHNLVRSLQIFLGARDKVAPQKVYLGIHHRLDLETSGVLLFTKQKEANAPVAQAFQNRTVEKTYLALSMGKLDQPRVIKSHLGESARNRRIICSVSRGGKYAETAIRSLECHELDGRPVTLVEASPKTGRTHQIRVHLGENNLPILGDRTYGVSYSGAPRVMLHAWKLRLLGKTFTTPLPEDFRALNFHEPRA
ncbi:MAG TPA: RluA family pseudouridine synthase [Bdellovibrionota bacterium]|jgi:RluA family pseudouridine synthase